MSRQLPRVLIVDDQEMVLSILRRELRDRFEVDSAPSGAKALELLRSGTDYGLILLDRVMPEINGLDVIDVVEREMPQILERVVVITGGVPATEEMRRYTALNVKLLFKPFGQITLDGIVKGYLARIGHEGKG